MIEVNVGTKPELQLVLALGQLLPRVEALEEFPILADV